MARILIAEDERDIRDLVDFTLKFAGYEVYTAANGLEALELAPQVMPDLILLDVRMPHMTGYEACRALKQLETVKDIPVVFLSAKGQDIEMQVGLEAGAVDYILKPFAPDDLARRVAEILQAYPCIAPDAAGAELTGPVAAGPEASAGQPATTVAGPDTAGQTTPPAAETGPESMPGDKPTGLTATDETG
ncbi:MAG: response regulator [Anaerolineae bacterium]|nr:response regulator [Anaerolineae bacterium]